MIDIKQIEDLEEHMAVFLAQFPVAFVGPFQIP